MLIPSLSTQQSVIFLRKTNKSLRKQILLFAEYLRESDCEMKCLNCCNCKTGQNHRPHN